MAYIDALNGAVIYADGLNIYAKKWNEPIGFANNRVSLLFLLKLPLDILSLRFPDEPFLKLLEYYKSPVF